MKNLVKFIKEEKGQGLTEYGLILLLIAVAVVVVLTNFGEKVKAYYEYIYTNFDF